MDRVDIEREGVRYYCTSEEQLKRFLAAGYRVIEQPKATKTKTTATKK